MKRLRQIFKVSLAKVFFAANYVICAFVFDWFKFEKYLNTPAKIDCHIEPRGGSIDFSVYGMYGGEDFITLIFIIFLVLFFILFLIFTFPSIAITHITIEMLKTSFPFWCYETFEIVYIPIFAVINSFYWVCLAYIIELGYSKYRQLNPPKSKYLSVFPK